MPTRIAAVLAVLLAFAATPPPASAYLDADAAYGMALDFHQPSDGRTANYRLAMLMYCRADSDGHANAAFAIGLIYGSGIGFVRNDARAYAWFLRAASLGHPEGRSMAKIFRPRGKHGRAVCPNGWGRSTRLFAPTEIRAMVEEMAPTFRLDPKLVLAVIQVESAYQPHAVSSANAQGLMQLIPATAARFGVRDAFDARDNLRGGMAYLRWLLKNFDGDVTKTVAAYNAGENAVKRYGGIPPYRETQNYVRKIRLLYNKPRHPI